MSGAPTPIRFRIAERTLWTATRRLRRLNHTLPELLGARAMNLPALEELDGFDIRSLPEASLASLDTSATVALVRQRYPRHYLRLDGGWPAYWQGFSAKTRSTLKRKRARWAAAGGPDVRSYRTPAEVGAFAALAGALSARTYQHRLLGAGLPTGPAAIAAMHALAADDRFRGYILFHGGEPAAYLYLPVEHDVVRYAHLGYAPEHAALSPGAVLQLAALEHLFAEGGSRLFDFTEGDGAHKRLFGRESVACADVLLLRRTWRNRLLLDSLRRWDSAVAGIATAVERRGWKPHLKRLLRR